MKVLHIYLIHTPTLVDRKKFLNGTIEYVKKIGEKYEYNVKINLITEPNIPDIDRNIDEFNKRVNYDKETDEDFNKTITKLNAPQISNIEKHRLAYQNIKYQADLPLKNNDDLYLILEDDVVISNEYTKNFESLMNVISELDKWDILFTCLSNKNEMDESVKLMDSRDNFKILLSKSSYFIRPETAYKLNEFLNTFKYTLKHAISKFIWDNKDIRSCIVNRHIFLEGTKLGLLLSSVNNNNILFQNNDFINLARLTSAPTIDTEIYSKSMEIYKRLEPLNSADVLHTMGILHYKKEDYENAKKYLTNAVKFMQKNNGYLTNNSEILNNCINMFQYDQDDLEECINKQGKYCVKN